MCPGVAIPSILKFCNPTALDADNARTEEYLVAPWPQKLGPDDLVQLQGKLKLLPVQAQALAYQRKADNHMFICNANTTSQLQANKGNAASPLTLPKASLLL
jgi:hypothetical protein